MLVQRLSFRAAIGQLRVIPVWQALRRNGARIYRWSTNVDRWTNTETMTVDIVGSGPLRMDDIAAMLSETPIEISVTLFHLSMVSTAS